MHVHIILFNVQSSFLTADINASIIPWTITWFLAAPGIM